MAQHRDVLFLRVSKDEQGTSEHYSIPMQEKICRAYSEASEGAVLHVFVEEQSTYTDDLDNRPVFQEALRYAIAHKASRFVVYAFDRFARDPAVFYAADRMLAKESVVLCSATQYHRPGSADGELTKGFHALLAHVESIRLSQRVRDALAEKMHGGGWMGKEPYGYKRQDGTLVVVEDQAEGYLLAVRACLEGAESFREIARMLNAAGFRTATGRRWGGDGVAKMLRSPAYLGMVVVLESASPLRRSALPGDHAALIDRPTWERVQARCRELTNQQGNMAKAMAPYALSGVLLCGRCSAGIVGMCGDRKYKRRYYHCGRRKRYGPEACDLPMFHVEAVEEEVAKLLDSLVLPEGWRDLLQAQLQRGKPTGPTLAQIEEEERRLTELYQEGYIADFAEFKRRWSILQTRRDEIREVRPAAVLDLGAYLERGIGNLWRESPDQKARRRLVKGVIRRISIDGEKASAPRLVRVEWRPEAAPLMDLIESK